MEKLDHADAWYTAIALCAVGAEKAASNELKKLGLHIIDSGFGKVRFRSDIAGLYRSLMCLRTADRVLLETASFPAADFDALFEQTQAVPWERFIQAQTGIKIAKVRSNRSRLKAETSIQSMVHKAAANRLCASYGVTRLPEHGYTREGKEAEIRVYIEKDMVSLLLDISGEALFKRGYRMEGGIAPLRETTAAAMLLLSGWKRKYPLYDPFCGAGTILTEALMYAWDMAPGIGRRFALSNLLIADNELEESIRGELRSSVNVENVIRIAGSDEDAKAISITQANIQRLKNMIPADAARTTTQVTLETLPMQKAQPPFTDPSSRGFLVTNPPYGKRLGDPCASEHIYGEMGSLARHFPRWKLAVITDHPGFESFFGKKAHSCREIKSGAAAAYFFQYEEL